ncbi:MAG: hypothetical protein DRQ78_03150 [Epsilonproteobacteria bacterium]|nr:MAG: hypothetical protein DRQ78_03150 [Campylobacterota bacterium]
MLKNTILGLFTLSSFLLTGCGLENSSDSPTTSYTSGTFVDSAVIGLDYECSSGDTGATDNDGTYTCPSGDTVIFILGGFTLGPVTASIVPVTPLTIYPTNPEASLNLAQLLQTLDNDGNATNGIDLSPTKVALLDDITIDFEDENFDNNISTILGETIVSEEDAQAHLDETLSGLGVPVFTSDNNVTVAENQTSAITLVATDNDTIAYSISGTDASSFTVGSSSGEVTFNTAPDYETKSSYTFLATATDDTGNASSQTVVITILDIDEVDTTAPTITILGDNPATYEASYSSYTDAGATVSDNVDSNVSIITSGSVISNTVGTYTITYSATDSAGNTATESREVNVVDTTAPTITIQGDNPASLEVGETYTDAGAKAHSPNKEGPDTVTITSNTVDTSTVGTYEVVYSSTDDYNNTATATRVVNVTSAIDTTAPVFTSSTSQIAESGATYATTLVATDDNTITYSIVDTSQNNNSDLTVDSSTGEVTFANSNDYEGAFPYSFIAYATDVEGNEANQTVTIELGDLTAPEFTSDTTVSVYENQTSAITLVATDSDESGVTYNISDTDNFEVNSSTGVVTFITAPVYTDGLSYSFTATATDSSENEVSEDILISILDSLIDGLVTLDTTSVRVDVTDSNVTDYTLIYSTDIDCNASNYYSCANAQTKNSGALSRSTTSGYMWLKNGDEISEKVNIENIRFPRIKDHKVVSYNDKLWLYMGVDEDSNKNEAVWSSTNGADWVQEANTTAFGARQNAEVVNFNDKLWLIGGSNDDENTDDYSKDIYSSSDGITWSLEANTTSFLARERFSATVFDDKIWLTGGGDWNLYEGLNDVWYSSDGINWTEATSSADFPIRYDTTLTTHDSKMWVIGGYSDTSNLSDVWSSIDGITWTEEVSIASFASSDNGYDGRYGHQTVSFNDKLYVISGFAGNSTSIVNDVWSSSDGVSWTLENNNTSFNHREYFQVVEHSSELYLIGGEEKEDHEYSNDVFSSSDAITWSRETTAKLPEQTDASSVVFNGKIWVVGGSKERGGYSDDVWSSEDGINWTQETNSAAFGDRIYHKVLAYDDKLWLIAGKKDSVYMNDIWSSEDGITWTEVTSSANFSARTSFSAVVSNGLMLVVGGYDNTKLNDVWSSSDGETWTQMSDGNFTARSGSSLVDFNSKLWMFGGGGTSNTYNDILTSDDNGTTWTEEVADGAADFSQRSFSQVVLFDEVLYMIAGQDASYNKLKDVWSSTDGINWTEVTTNDAFSEVLSHNVVIHNSKMHLIGGDMTVSRPDYLSDVWSSSDGASWYTNESFNFVFE